MPKRKPLGEPIRTTTRLLRSFGYYVAALTALLLGLTRLKKPLLALIPGLPDWAVFPISMLPLCMVLAWQGVPQLIRYRRARRLQNEDLYKIRLEQLEPGHFRIQPYESTKSDRARFLRADNAHVAILEWLRSTTQPFLFLTARSGTGKTSLLNAYVIPELATPGSSTPSVRTFVIRSFGDPVNELKEEMLRPGSIWKQPPSNQTDVLEILDRAYNKMRPARLLFIFDQFEEIVLLHESDHGALDSFKDLIKSFSRAPIDGLHFLFVVRTDYIGALHELGLPAMREGANWTEIGPFREPAARTFLSSGIELGPAAIDTAIEHMQEVEEARGLIRPITLNMFGLSLAASRTARRNWSRKQIRALLVDYVRDSILVPDIKDFAHAVTSKMVTESGIKRPKSVATLATETGFRQAAVLGCLYNLALRGLVRRVNEAENIWEVSHDFVARLLAQILFRTRKTAYQKIHAAVIPLGFVLWAALAITAYTNWTSRADRATARLASKGAHFATTPAEHYGVQLYLSPGSEGEFCEYASLMSEIPDLTALDMSLRGLTDEDATCLRRASKLRELSIGPLRLSEVGFDALSALPELEELSIGPLTDPSRFGAPNLFGPPRTLNCNGLGVLLSSKALRKLTIRNTTLEAEALSTLESSNIEELDMWEPLPQDLASATFPATLKRLRLMRAKPGAVSELKVPDWLEALSIEWSPCLTNEFEAIGAMPNLKRLIFIDDKAIDDGIFEHLARLRGNPSVTILRCPITTEGLSRFQASHPEIRVSREHDGGWPTSPRFRTKSD